MPIDIADTLFYSDDPETLAVATQGNVEGVLFAFDLPARTQQRFLYYHVNADHDPRYFALRLLNRGDAPAALRWLGGVPLPSTAYLHVGHDATAGYLEALAGGKWTSVDLAAGAETVLRADAADHGALVTGIFEFVLDRGSDVRVSLVVATSPDRVGRVAEIGETFKVDGKGRAGRFDISDKSSFPLAFALGGAAATLRLGMRTFPNERAGMTTPLRGEYGVISTIALTVTNDTDNAAKVAVYESARGGASTGSYLVDGRVVNSQVMPADGSRHKLWVFDVPAHGIVRSTMLAIPDSGSSSPVEIILDADDGSPDPDTAGSLVAFGPSYGV